MTPDEREARLLRLEQRELQEEVEASVAEMEAAERTLDMALVQFGNRSIDLVVQMPDRELRGQITHVGEDIASLHSIMGQRYVFVLDAIVGIRAPAERGAAAAVSAGHPRTLMARLREMVVQEEQATLARRTGEPVLGRVIAVTPTHVEMVDGKAATWLLPINQISWLGPITS